MILHSWCFAMAILAILLFAMSAKCEVCVAMATFLCILMLDSVVCGREPIWSRQLTNNWRVKWAYLVVSMQEYLYIYIYMWQALHGHCKYRNVLRHSTYAQNACEILNCLCSLAKNVWYSSCFVSLPTIMYVCQRIWPAPTYQKCTCSNNTIHVLQVVVTWS